MTLKQIASYIFYFLPKFIAVPLRKYYQKRQLKLLKERYKRTRVSKEDIIAILDRLNLDGDVFLHSSMSSIGSVNCSTKFLSEFLLEKININRNTLLVPAMPFNGMSSREFLRENTVIDFRSVPIKTGALNRFFALHQDAKRSLHPTHSVVAIGPKAHYYLFDHHLGITPFGIHSPYYKLIENDVKILMIGAELKYLTFVHTIEDILGKYYPIDSYLKEIYSVKVINPLGESFDVKTRCHSPLKRIKLDINRLLPYYKKYDAIEIFGIGDSAVSVLDAKRSIYAEYRALLNGVSAYGRFHLTKRSEGEINKQIISLEHRMF
jgi:aminoglycoside 3-N-acetyltransferase